MAEMLRFSRRAFCAGAGAAVLGARGWAQAGGESGGYALVAKTDRGRILAAANKNVLEKPRTLTDFPSPKSTGGPHDFFSQADYFWPDPAHPDGPYINRDGQSNPENFNGHRKAMIALSIQMPALTAGWMLTGDRRFGAAAADHLRAWFVTEATRMTPNLEYSQGVHGVSTGRSYGIIDTLHLVEVARAASHVAPAMMTPVEQAALKGWFHDYLYWMKTSEKGKTEGKALNNHAACWALQAAEFARLIGDGVTRGEVREQYERVLLPGQMGQDGSFPKELVRTKPYSYSIFNFDVMAMICQSLADGGEDLFGYRTADGRGICKGAAFLYPFLKDKSAWPYAKDVEHFGALPVRSPGLLFAGLSCGREEYVQLWKGMDADPTDAEVIRNYPVRQPLLWFS